MHICDCLAIYLCIQLDQNSWYRVSGGARLLGRVEVIGSYVVLVRRRKLDSALLEVMESTAWK